MTTTAFNNDTTLDELAQDPTKFGAPTFEEFARNREKYMGREDDKLSQADIGSQIFRKSNLVRKHIYEIEGFRCKTLEEVEKTALSMGIKLKELDYRPQVLPLGGGQCDFLIKFISKAERDKRNERP